MEENKEHKVPIRKIFNQLVTPEPQDVVGKKDFEFEKWSGLVSDLDLTPLIVEPPATGIFEKFVPWINLAVLVIILLILIFK